MEIGRLNGIIGKLEQGKSVCVTFAPGDAANAQIAATEPYDGIVFEMEHGPYDVRSLRDCLPSNVAEPGRGQHHSIE